MDKLRVVINMLMLVLGVMSLLVGVWERAIAICTWSIYKQIKPPPGHYAATVTFFINYANNST